MSVPFTVDSIVKTELNSANNIEDDKFKTKNKITRIVSVTNIKITVPAKIQMHLVKINPPCKNS